MVDDREIILSRLASVEHHADGGAANDASFRSFEHLWSRQNLGA
jgi:hypothetical protein